jgi:hypothetical protein
MVQISRISRSRNHSSRLPLLQIFLTISLCVISFYVGNLSSCSTTFGNSNCSSNSASLVTKEGEGGEGGEDSFRQRNIDAIVQERVESGMCLCVYIVYISRMCKTVLFLFSKRHWHFLFSICYVTVCISLLFIYLTFIALCCCKRTGKDSNQ